jgi:hypothetical protein
MPASSASAPDFCAFLRKGNMTSTTLCLRIEFMQKQVVELCKRAETIEQVNEVFKIASELIELTNRFDPMSFALYEMVLERRTELQKQQRRVEAASGKP